GAAMTRRRALHRARSRVLAAVVLAVAPGLGVASGVAQAQASAGVVGVVKEASTGAPIAGALVIVQCNCLQGQLDAQTGDDGLYAFHDLPPGRYTVQVLYQEGVWTRFMEVTPGAAARVDFAVDPQRQVDTIVVEPTLRSD